MSWLLWFYNYFFDGDEDSAPPDVGITLDFQVTTELGYDLQVSDSLPLDLEVTSNLTFNMHAMRV